MVTEAPLGVIEGFYGTPWGWAERAANFEFLRERGYDFYIYAPKSDDGLRKTWRAKWPAEYTERLIDLAAHCRNAGLAFGIGFSPHEVWRDASARAELGRAVRHLNRIGPEILCILFDDMRGDMPGLAETQAEIATEIAATSTADRFVFCPTYYSFDPVLEATFGTASKDYLTTLGKRLDPKIGIFWTGPKVSSAEYPAEHLREVAGLLRRKPFLWDNHLANDGAASAGHLHLKTPLTRADLANDLTAGCAINPMNQPALSRIPLAMIAGGMDFAEACNSVCGAALGAEIVSDRSDFQDRGLESIPDGARAALIEKYRQFDDHACAREIIAFLSGAYAFDPACLTG